MTHASPGRLPLLLLLPGPLSACQGQPFPLGNPPPTPPSNTTALTQIGSSPENSPKPSARKLVLRLMAEFLPPVRSRDVADHQP